MTPMSALKRSLLCIFQIFVKVFMIYIKLVKCIVKLFSYG